jgi:hypothetical protein
MAAHGLLGVNLVTGCNKNGKTAAQAVAVVPVPPISPVFRDPQVKEHLKQLNAELAEYMNQHGRPSSFESFVAATHVPSPPPPPRTQYMLYNNTITLGWPSVPPDNN